MYVLAHFAAIANIGLALGMHYLFEREAEKRCFSVYVPARHLNILQNEYAKKPRITT
jgi:hypothetical protein